MDRKLGFPVTLDRSFENGPRYDGIGRSSPIHLDQRSNSTRRNGSSHFKGNGICGSNLRCTPVLVQSLSSGAQAAFEDASRLRDVRAVCELRGLTYDLNSVRLTENAYGKFYRLREVGIDVVTKCGRSGL